MTTLTQESEHPEVQDLDRVTIRFAGDSGDGMQITGTQFTKTSAVFGNDISTVPDIPAEIRAPQGSTTAYTARALKKVEDALFEIPELQSYFALVSFGLAES